jgi:hypothetical protein
LLGPVLLEKYPISRWTASQTCECSEPSGGIYAGQGVYILAVIIAMWTAVIIIYGRVPSFVNRYYVCLICDMYTVFFCCFYYWIPFSWNGPCMPFKIRGQRVVQYISPAGSFVLWLFCSQCLRDMTNEQLEWLTQIFFVLCMKIWLYLPAQVFCWVHSQLSCYTAFCFF